MTDTTNPKLAVIRGLLAKAERTDNDHEAEAFRAKAYDLIAKYGIDEAELAMSDPDLNIVGDAKIEMHAPFAQEKVSLFMAVAAPMGVRAVQRKEWRDGKFYRASQSDRQVVFLHVFGTRGDLERAQLLYTSLLLQQSSELARHELPDYVAYGTMGEKAAYRRSWLIGYANRIQDRLFEAERRAQADKPTMTNAATGETKSTALVLASKGELVDSAMAAEYPRLKQGKSRRLSGGGFGAGHAAGGRANLGGTGVSGAGRKAVGS